MFRHHLFPRNMTELRIWQSQVTSKQQVSQIFFFYLFIFYYRDYVVCHLKLEIELAIIAAN